MTPSDRQQTEGQEAYSILDDSVPKPFIVGWIEKRKLNALESQFSEANETIEKLREALKPLAYSVERHSDKSLQDYAHVDIRVTPQQIINAREALAKCAKG